MQKTARHDHIKKIVAQTGAVSVAKLNEILEVSEATIRRDLEEMDKLGWIRRTRGGAMPIQRASKEPPLPQRANEHADEKARIGRRAASFVQAGQTVFLGSGSTVHQIAAHLQDVGKITVITNALNVVNALSGNPDIELFVIGGMLRQSEQSMVGHIAEAAIREFRADHVFVGMRGIDPHHGFTNDFMLEAAIDRAILSIAPHVVVVADNSKIGRVSTIFLAPISAAHSLVTDSDTPDSMISDLRDAGLDVQIA